MWALYITHILVRNSWQSVRRGRRDVCRPHKITGDRRQSAAWIVVRSNSSPSQAMGYRVVRAHRKRWGTVFAQGRRLPPTNCTTSDRRQSAAWIVVRSSSSPSQAMGYRVRSGQASAAHKYDICGGPEFTHNIQESDCNNFASVAVCCYVSFRPRFRL